MGRVAGEALVHCLVIFSSVLCNALMFFQFVGDCPALALALHCIALPLLLFSNRRVGLKGCSLIMILISADRWKGRALSRLCHCSLHSLPTMTEKISPPTGIEVACMNLGDASSAFGIIIRNWFGWFGFVLFHKLSSSISSFYLIVSCFSAEATGTIVCMYAVD